MLRCHDGATLLRGREHGSARKEPRLSQDAAGALMQCCRGIVGEKPSLPARDRDVMNEVCLHVLTPTTHDAKGRELWQRSLSIRAVWPDRTMGRRFRES